MSADYPGPLSIDRSSVTRQVKRAHPLIDRNAIYPMIPPRGIGDGGRSMVAKLERVALREALPQRVVECAALEMRHRCKPIGGSNPSLSATIVAYPYDLICEIGTRSRSVPKAVPKAWRYAA
jgi:hypothetical protein